MEIVLRTFNTVPFLYNELNICEGLGEMNSKRSIFLKAERIALRTVECGDEEFMVFCQNSPEIRSTFFTAFPVNQKVMLQRIQALYQDNYDYLPFIAFDLESGAEIGLTAFHRMDLAGRVATFSIIIPDEQSRGKKYGQEILTLMLDYGFSNLNLHRIQLVVAANNSGAIHIYKKAGFQEEGTMRQAMYQNNQYHDFQMMAMLQPDYFARKRDDV